MRLAIIIGTRPDAIKMAPVALAFRSAGIPYRLICSGQHPDLVKQALDAFSLRVDVDLNAFHSGASLNMQIALMLPRLNDALSSVKTDLVFVHGDTATAFSAALAAAHLRIPVVHVEAGLRTGDTGDPFPEEFYRRLVSQVSALHCAPTRAARRALLREGIPAVSIIVSGNPIVDAIRLMGVTPRTELADEHRRHLLITCHRRESWGRRYREVCAAALELAERADTTVKFVLHPNPELRDLATSILGPSTRVEVLEPLAYPSFLALLKQAYLVLTDSGGVQEEAATLGRPVLVLRTTTERREGLILGSARVVGTDRSTIVATATELIEDRDAYLKMATASAVYGDGFASERIVAAIMRYFGSESNDGRGSLARSKASCSKAIDDS
jgi:UDP-N-acetylglucosamine 2-epimerase (non-hydrolysing)